MDSLGKEPSSGRFLFLGPLDSRGNPWKEYLIWRYSVDSLAAPTPSETGPQTE